MSNARRATQTELTDLVGKARLSAPWIEADVADRFLAAGHSVELAEAQLFTMMTDPDALAQAIVKNYRGRSAHSLQ